MEKPTLDGRKAPRTQAQKEALQRAQTALRKKREDKAKERALNQPPAQSEPKRSEPKQSEPKQSEPKSEPKQSVPKSIRRKKQTRIILEDSSSDSEGQELVIRRGRGSRRPSTRRQYKKYMSEEDSDEDEESKPNSKPSETKSEPKPEEPNVDTKNYTAQQILRAFNL
jgi:hypothetical protein